MHINSVASGILADFGKERSVYRMSVLDLLRLEERVIGVLTNLGNKFPGRLPRLS